MTPEDQWNWITQQEYRDPRWADAEFEIRRRAVEIVDQVLERGEINVVFLRPAATPGGFGTLHIRKADIARVGGLEQILLIEEILRSELRCETTKATGERSLNPVA